jgi:hypothetical protein
MEWGGDNMDRLKRKQNKNKTVNKKLIIGLIVLLSSTLIIYLGFSTFFMNRFYFGSTINCISVSGKTVQEINDNLSAEIDTYVLEIKERGDQKEQLAAKDIGIKYTSTGQVQDIKDKQNPFKWILTIFNSKDYKLDRSITYDEELLKKYIDNLSCFNKNNIVEPQSATIKYKDSSYVVVDEVNGNKVIKDALYSNVVKAILAGEKSIDLDALNCYETPKYTSKSQEIIDTKNTLNKYVSSKITYTFGDFKEVLDASTINTWLSFNENFETKIDEEKVKAYVTTLSRTYNTVEKTREILTSFGTTVKVNAGDYGWLINSAKERVELMDAIKQGQVITKEPVYLQKAMTREGNDIGKTYVEIDLTKQHLWFYKNGALVVEGDVVTGNVSNNNSTPPGVYTLKYKQKDATLKGADYNTPVSYWMPFNGNIGIHDATWRDIFGGNIYLTGGSHGCVNAPFEVAQTIFASIEAGTPVICYFE